jgi:hypothetical protein
MKAGGLYFQLHEFKIELNAKSWLIISLNSNAKLI